MYQRGGTECNLQWGRGRTCCFGRTFALAPNEGIIVENRVLNFTSYGITGLSTSRGRRSLTSRTNRATDFDFD